MFIWSPGATEIFCKNKPDKLEGFRHTHTRPDRNGALDCTQTASHRQVLTFPKCLHSTCWLVLPQCQCQAPEFTQSDYQAGG